MMRRKMLLIVAAIVAGIAILGIAYVGMRSACHPAGSSPSAEDELFKLAGSYAQQGELVKECAAYQKIIELYPASSRIAHAQEGLDNVRIKILFSPLATPESTVYVVAKGDTLQKIAKKCGTTVELIKRSNNLASDIIRIGQRLKVAKQHFSIVVDKSQNILTLKADGAAFKTYRVSTGKNNSTPVGTFTIVNKIINPPWYTGNAIIPPDSPKNILGSRWMGISQPGYGIHGTTEPEAIGKQATAGCVRMRNSDVEELYTIVPEGTEVIIID